jgi:hypothetical protein
VHERLCFRPKRVLPRPRFHVTILESVRLYEISLADDSFLSFVPALLYVSYASPRLVFILPYKKRRLLPLRELPAGGIILLVSRIALALALIGSNVALAVSWQRSASLGREYSGLAAWILEILASVSDHQDSADISACHSCPGSDRTLQERPSVSTRSTIFAVLDPFPRFENPDNRSNRSYRVSTRTTSRIIGVPSCPLRSSPIFDSSIPN